MYVEVIVCYIIVVFLRHGVFAELLVIFNQQVILKLVQEVAIKDHYFGK